MKRPYQYLKQLVILLLTVTGLQAFGQGNRPLVTLTGVVLDSNHQGVPGVSISVQESSETATTGADGKFSIQGPANAILVLKKSGYLAQTYETVAGSKISITMARAKTLAGDDDLVEIPFGVRHKRYLTEAVSSVSTSDLPQPSTSALPNILSGRLAGLSVLQAGTQPGNDFSVYRVRGRTSFNFVNALVLVDGIERDMSDLDFEEVESFTVLKDPATLSWYGLRGSNGVILVTTKKGSRTKSSINLSGQYGFQLPDHLVKPLNSYEYASLYNEALLNDNPTAIPRYDQTALDAYRNGSDPYRYPDNNYQERFLKSATPFQRYVASAQGGEKKVRYFAMMSYLNQGGLFNETKGPNYDSNNGYKRFNFRSNVDFDVNSRLTISVNLAGRVENRIDPTYGTLPLMGLINGTRPNAYPILNRDGTFGGTTEDQNNILGAITANGVIKARKRVGFANLKATQKLDMILDGLSFDLLVSYDTKGDYTSGFTQNYRVFDATVDGNPIPYRTEARLAYRSAAYENAYRASEVWTGFDYNKTFQAHKINASVRGMRSAIIDFRSRTDFSQRYQAFSGRVEYAFKDRYLLKLVGSYAGDDDLPPNNRYGFFPAVSAGWIVSDESFLSDNNVLSFLKIRASYGKTGNTEIGFGEGALRRFPYQSRYTRNLVSNAAGYQFGTGFALTGSANELNIGNPYITWETLTTANLGVDFNLFKNTVTASLDAFKNKRTGILTTASIPDIIGQSSGDLNEGAVNSQGIEGSVFYHNNFGEVDFSLNANFLATKDKVIYQGGQAGVPAYQSTIGLGAGSGLYYVSDGLYQSKQEIEAGPKSTLSNQIMPGDIRYKDINNDNIIDANDRIRFNLGTPNYFGFGTAVKYKIFDLNAQFQGTVGQKTNIRGIIDTGPSAFNQESLKRWTPATAATAIYPRVGLANLGNNRTDSDFWLRDADYVKLKTLELGVTLPQSFTQKLKIQSIRFYLNGFNLLTFSKLDLDVDPELPFLGRGSTYPYVKTYSFGLNVKL
ncbi:TonB-dependent receptor [Ravibacter arvi]|uniref:TonB-dependent receptor n=1 Tax=Ravibacter arvi TaxID=2051041 RepID=A0ABP8M0K8_9BACT